VGVIIIIIMYKRSFYPSSCFNASWYFFLTYNLIVLQAQLKMAQEGGDATSDSALKLAVLGSSDTTPRLTTELPWMTHIDVITKARIPTAIHSSESACYS
jgi:hypothetical protein